MGGEKDSKISFVDVSYIHPRPGHSRQNIKYFDYENSAKERPIFHNFEEDDMKEETYEKSSYSTYRKRSIGPNMAMKYHTNLCSDQGDSSKNFNVFEETESKMFMNAKRSKDSILLLLDMSSRVLGSRACSLPLESISLILANAD